MIILKAIATLLVIFVVVSAGTLEVRFFFDIGPRSTWWAFPAAFTFLIALVGIFIFAMIALWRLDLL